MTTTRSSRSNLSRNKVTGESNSSAILIDDNDTPTKTVTQPVKKVVKKKPISSSAKR